MNRRMWLGGLFLTLCGWAGQAAAQEVVWRPASRPSERLPTASMRVAPAALGAPLPSQPAAAPEGAVIAASYHPTAAPKPVPRAWPAGPEGLEAAELAAAPPAEAQAPAEAAPEEGGFAADRPVTPAFYEGEPIAVAPQPGPAPSAAPPRPLAMAAEQACAAEDEPFALFPRLEAWRPHFYARGEYLLWSVKKDTVPVLVTTSARNDFGILGRPSTQVLFGGDGIDGGARSGARFTAGLWLDECETKAIEVSGFFLGTKTERFDANSAQFPLIARPFFSVNRGTEFAQLTAFFNDATGSVAVRDKSDLWGVEANARCKLCCGNACPDDCDGPGWGYRVDGLAGVRYLDLREDLSITENIRNFPTATNGLTNLGLQVFDDFATHNQFYGGQVGLDATLDRGPWSFNATGKIALGDTRQEVRINGSQLVTNLNGTQSTFKGGLLALPSNIGTFHKDAFSVVPEVDLTVSYHLNDHVRLLAGYDFLYWSSVVRPGQQIDRNLNETQIPNFNPPGTVLPPGPNRPAVLFQRSDFWAQGLNLGLEFRY